MKLQPKNWSTFQHYKDRNPPWIKLHKDQLNKPDFMSLSLASVGLANMLWLLASETKDGCFDGTMEHLTFRLRKTEREIKTNLKCLINKGFFVVVCGVLADDTESCSEGETEGETYLAQFDLFWNAFADKRGRDKALLSWNKIKLNDQLCQQIINGAEKYALNRVAILAKNGTPKMAQGWLTDRRWEDEDVEQGSLTPQQMQMKNLGYIN